ncbi:hypothetical protein QP427_07135, partial [Bifidobacterium sp. UMB1230]|nr:hypothetical protein [Bifidobacterium sp. UMB1230]
MIKEIHETRVWPLPGMTLKYINKIAAKIRITIIIIHSPLLGFHVRGCPFLRRKQELKQLRQKEYSLQMKHGIRLEW